MSKKHKTLFFAKLTLVAVQTYFSETLMLPIHENKVFVYSA